MKIYLVDGTYELFRSHFGAPPRKAPDGREVGATLGLLRSLLMLLTTPGISHVACAFDHVIESFRNDLYPGYKTGAGVDHNLIAQFELSEEAVSALGLVVWSMVEFEADDALSSATARFKDEAGVDQIVICSPDKDLAQLVSGSRIVGWDRRRDILIDEDIAAAVPANDAASRDQLGQILIRRADHDLVDPSFVLETGGRAGQGIVGLELHHRPDHQPKRGNGLFGKLELGYQVVVNARAGLVAGVQVVTEGLDHVIERAGHVADARRSQQHQQAA